MNEKNTMLNPEFGYKHLDPIPNDYETNRFYESQYYDLIRKGGRGTDLRKLMAGGEQRERELNWLRKGLYTDISHILADITSGKRVLDIGCGNGELVAFLQEQGFDAMGIEPSVEAARNAMERGLSVEAATLENFVGQDGWKNQFDAVVLLNVLEHAPDPKKVMSNLSGLLKPDGIVCIRVPNDFSEIQQAALEGLGVEPWWIAYPDHINYFNFESLRGFMEGFGCDVVYEQGDFPMEMFLLMGENYVSTPEIGGKCHEKREAFELGISPEFRRKIYKSFASIGLGRNCLMFGRNRSA